MKRIIPIVLVIAALAGFAKFGFFTGGKLTGEKPITEQTTEETISKVVAGGNSVRSEILRNYAQTYKDYRVYKSEDGKGVIYEYIFLNRLDPEKLSMNTEAAKNHLLTTLRNNKLWPQTKTILKKGIYFHYQYKGPDGDTVLQFKIGEGDI